MLRSVIVGDPTTYWSAPLSPEACAAMVAKYDALAQLEAMGAGKPREQRIREAARRWPGSLRESQLAGPAVCEARRRAALAGAQGPARTRGEWCATEPAVPLWVSAHELVGDLVAWRRRLSRGVAATPAALIEHLSERPQSARWDRAAVQALVDRPIRIRLAYLHLAATSGLPLPVLSRTLFAREGRWERSADDRPGLKCAALPIEIARFFPLLSELQGNA